MVYNITAVGANTTGILSFVRTVDNAATGGWLTSLFFIGVLVVIFTSFMFRTNDSVKSVAATAFISMGLGILLRAVSLIGDKFFFIVIIGAAAGLAFCWSRT